jgi:hypothetical protein
MSAANAGTESATVAATASAIFFMIPSRSTASILLQLTVQEIPYPKSHIGDPLQPWADLGNSEKTGGACELA